MCLSVEWRAGAGLSPGGTLMRRRYLCWKFSAAPKASVHFNRHSSKSKANSSLLHPPHSPLSHLSKHRSPGLVHGRRSRPRTAIACIFDIGNLVLRLVIYVFLFNNFVLTCALRDIIHLLRLYVKVWGCVCVFIFVFFFVYCQACACRLKYTIQ